MKMGGVEGVAKTLLKVFFVKSVEFRVILTKYTAENLIEDVQMFFCLIETSFSRMDEAEVAKW